MSDKKETKGFFGSALGTTLSAANRVVGNRPSKKVGTALVAGGVGYGILTGDVVGACVLGGAGFVVREHERLESIARTLDFFVANVLAAREEAREQQ